MDLNNLFASGTAVIELKNPLTGDILMDESKPPKPMSLTVMGTHTREYKSIERKAGFDAIKRNKNTDVEKMDFEEFESAVLKNDGATMELKSKAVIGCNIFMDGKNLKFSQENIFSMLSDERTSWVYNQLTKELEESDLFFKS